MAGTISPGQTLTSNPNVSAPAGFGNGIWGANGGGIVPVGGGATDQTGYVKPVAATIADGETSANYLPNTFQPVLSQENTGALSGQTKDSALTPGGLNSG